MVMDDAAVRIVVEGTVSEMDRRSFCRRILRDKQRMGFTTFFSRGRYVETNELGPLWTFYGTNHSAGHTG